MELSVEAKAAATLAVNPNATAAVHVISDGTATLLGPAPPVHVSVAAFSALEQKNKQLIAQVQLLQQRIEQLEGQGSGSAASSSVQGAVAACGHCGQLLPSPKLSIGQQLHKDALHCIFAYLSLPELPSAMGSCRVWYAAMRSLPLRNESFCFKDLCHLECLLLPPPSPLARHIIRLKLLGDVCSCVTRTQLEELASRLPRLVSLVHSPFPRMFQTERASGPSFYPSLRELELNLAPRVYSKTVEHRDAAVCNNTLHDIGAAQHSLRSLRLTLPCGGLAGLPLSQPADWLSFDSLESLQLLTHLTIINGYLLASKQLAPIRRMRSLRVLSLGGFMNHEMEMLVAEEPDCAPLQLQQLDLTFTDVEASGDFTRPRTAELLLRIPTLQYLESQSITAEALRILAGLPDLHTLKLHVQPREVDGCQIYDWPTVCDGLASYCQLTNLTLEGPPLEELAALLLALPPSVRKLEIHCAGFLLSDVFLHCVSEGGLRQLHQLRAGLDLDDDATCTSAFMQASEKRLRACAPWIDAQIVI
jgi:hypothetical protein